MSVMFGPACSVRPEPWPRTDQPALQAGGLKLCETFLRTATDESAPELYRFLADQATRPDAEWLTTCSASTSAATRLGAENAASVAYSNESVNSRVNERESEHADHDSHDNAWVGL